MPSQGSPLLVRIEGTFLIVIGALHMGGEQGIVNMLEKDFDLIQVSRN